MGIILSKRLLSLIQSTMKYLYYKLYKSLKRVKTNDTPATNAMFLLSLIHFANFATLLILLNHFFKIKITLASKNEIITFAFIIMAIIYTFNYFLLYKKREKIYEKYKIESINQSRVGNAILVLYVIVSVVLLYLFGSKYPI
jgi:hypothetical protein